LWLGGWFDSGEARFADGIGLAGVPALVLAAVVRTVRRAALPTVAFLLAGTPIRRALFGDNQRLILSPELPSFPCFGFSIYASLRHGVTFLYRRFMVRLITCDL